MIDFVPCRISARLLSLVVVLCALCGLAAGQTSVPDPAIPVNVTPVRDSVQFLAFNKDRSVLGSSTTQASTYSLLCPAPADLKGTPGPGAPIVFNEGPRFLFETGTGPTGTNAIVGVGADFSGTSCKNTPALPFYGSSVSLLASDRSHQRVTAISTAGSGSPDVITSISTNGAGDYYGPGTLSKQGQTSLDSGGTYTAMVPDVDGTVGYTAITQVRTDTSTGNLWIYDPTFSRAVMVLGPGGVPLPAVNAFIVHNPNTTGGGLLVLTNQDLLSNANLGAPPQVTTPLTIIDMGLLGNLLQSHPTDRSVTLPYVSTIQTNLSYYAIFGSAFNVLDNKVYVLIGTGTSATNLTRQVVRYDPFHPSAPAETVVADISSVPLYPFSQPQIALNAAAGTMQILTAQPDAVYTVNITGTGDTAVPLAGTTFGDTGFDPVALLTNPRLGETYIASNSGKVDVITRPANVKPRGTINLLGPLSATAGQSTSLQIQSIFPLYDASLNTTPITLTATAQSTGKSFTFASVNTVDTLSSPRSLQGTFPTNDIYTVVASFPGDATYDAFIAPAVNVAVGVPLYQTSIAVTASASSATAGTASVTLTGTSYTPTGTIAIEDGVSKNTLATYQIVQGRFANPTVINFTIPAGTTSIIAVYSGDASNSTSTSSVTQVPIPVVKSNTTVVLSGPTTTQQANTAFNLTVALTSANGKVPTGQVIISVTPAGSSASQYGSVSAPQAFAAGGTTVPVTLAAGSYTFTASYPGDANFNASNSNPVAITVSASTTPTVSLNPTSLTFNTLAGTTSAYQNVVLTNTGGAALNIAGIAASGAGFTQVNGCPASLAAGANCTIRVSFAPSAPGNVTGAITITDNAAGSPHTVTLTGTSVAPLQFLVQGSTTFTSGQMVGTSSLARPVITVVNNTSGNYTVNITNSDPADFEGPGCSGGVLEAGQSCSIAVTFHPASAGSKTATFTLVGATGIAPLTFTGTGTTTCDADMDGDGLCDEWETKGFYAHFTNGSPDQFIDLPSMGAKVDHKDVFLHIDWMVTDRFIPGAHSHMPDSSAMLAVVTAFANAPVMNVDGTTGINLHIDCGADCYGGTGGITGSLSRAISLKEVNALDPTTYDPNTDAFSWTLFDTLSTSFLASGRSYAFHHVLFAHDQHPGYDSSGRSRNDPRAGEFFKGASDLVATLGEGVKQVGSVMEQSGTLMHELGHNLGLAHGGQNGGNYKPNYLSVMNYFFQFTGINTYGHDGLLDYSEYAFPDLYEDRLNEQLGLNYSAGTYAGAGQQPSSDHLGTAYFCTGENSGNASPHRTTYLNGQINWDCITKPSITYLPSVKAILDGENQMFFLSSFKDWPNLKFKGGAISGNGIGVAPLMTTSGNEATIDVESRMAPLDSVIVSGPGTLATAPGSTSTVRYTVQNKGQNDDSYTLTVASPKGWANAVVSPATLALAAGASAEVSITYTVPATAADGDGDHIVLKVKSVNAPLILDTANLFAYAATNPLPLSISNATVHFPAQTTGGTTVPVTVSLVNTGTAAVSFTSITGTAEFPATSHCGTSLAPGASCTVSLVFSPAAAGARTGTLTVLSSTGTPLTVALTGNASAPMLRPVVTLNLSPATTSTGQSVTLSANVAPPSGNAVPTGTVNFIDGQSNVIASAPVDTQGNASFTSTTLGATSYNLVAAYSGDATYLQTFSDPAPLSVVTATPSTLTLTASAPAVATGAPVTFTATVGGASTVATGTVTFLDGSKAIGTGTLNASGVATLVTSTLAAGPHSITATFPGDAFYAPSTSTALTETIGVFNTSIALTAPASPVTVGGAVALSATVTATAGGTPTGSVTFLDGTTSLGTATLNSAGVATLSVTTLQIGTHSITAQYAASGNFSASTSAARQVVILGLPDFTVSATPASLSITRGSTGTATFTVTPVNGYSGTVRLACGSLPQYASCSFSSAQLAFTASSTAAQTSTLTIDTTYRGQAMLQRADKASGGVNFASPFALPALLGGLSLLALRRRSNVRSLRLVAMLLVSGLLGALVLTGCGSSGPSQTPAGSYTVVVTVTDGTTSHAVNLPVTVN